MILQVKILQFLQEGTIERLGGTKTITVDTRIIAASNVNLEQGVKEGKFREDLFHRVNVVPLNIPPLRERPEDILLLANHFLREETQKLKKGQVPFSPAAMAAITAHPWPGNVRELQNRIRRGLAMTTDRIIWPTDLGLEEPPTESEEKLPILKEARGKAEFKVLQRALASTGYNLKPGQPNFSTSAAPPCTTC